MEDDLSALYDVLSDAVGGDDCPIASVEELLESAALRVTMASGRVYVVRGEG